MRGIIGKRSILKLNLGTRSWRINPDQGGGRESLKECVLRLVFCRVWP